MSVVFKTLQKKKCLVLRIASKIWASLTNSDRLNFDDSCSYK